MTKLDTDACNADLDHPCNGGATEDDPYRKCSSCREEAEYWTRYYGGLSRAQLKAMDPRNPETLDRSEDDE